jgi:hypothetical protein
MPPAAPGGAKEVTHGGSGCTHCGLVGESTSAQGLGGAGHVGAQSAAPGPGTRSGTPGPRPGDPGPRPVTPGTRPDSGVTGPGAVGAVSAGWSARMSVFMARS